MNRLVLFGILFRYFGARYLTWVAIAVAALTSIVSLIQTIELMRRVSTHQDETSDVSVITMAFLNIPSVIELILPFGLLAGSMMCFDAWNRSNEFVVTRGFGRSIWSVLSPAICAAALVGVIFVSIVNPIGSVTSTQYESKMNSIFGEGPQRLSVSADGLWLRDDHADGRFIIHGDTLDVETANIMNPIIYAFSADGDLGERTKASMMRLTEAGWMLDDAVQWDTEGNRREIGTILLPTGLAALDLEQSSAPPNSIAIFSLPAFINLLESAGLPTVDHRLYLHKLLSLPFLMVGLAMLGARFTLTNMTRGRRVHLFTRGAVISVTVFLFGQLMYVLGISMRLPPILAAWAPAAMVILAGAILLARLDEA